jgi:hypothetical protein
MEHRPGRRRNAAQSAAYRHRDVKAIVAAIEAKPEMVLIKLASKAIIFCGVPDQDALYGLVGAALYNDDELGPMAQQIAEAGVSIATALPLDTRRRRRGAVLERLVYSLVLAGGRGPRYREHEVRTTHNPRTHEQWTDAKELVVDGAAFEVYECKADGMADVGDVDQLSDIATSAIAAGADARATIAIFGSESALRIRAKAWRLTETIYGVPTEGLLSLAQGAPSKPIRPA